MNIAICIIVLRLDIFVCFRERYVFFEFDISYLKHPVYREREREKKIVAHTSRVRRESLGAAPRNGDQEELDV